MIDLNSILFLIMARGGSKGIPRKNIKLFAGKPLIYYSIDLARHFTNDGNICVSTDESEIKSVVEKYGIDVPFTRPSVLATDAANSYDVELHAINFYEKLGKKYEALVILQPTSPLRTKVHLEHALQLFTYDLDMVVSVKESDANPYYNLFEENEAGYLEKSKAGVYFQRQDCPVVYQYNGAIYVVNIASLKERPEHQFAKVKKFIMDDFSSIDLDKPIDWLWAEFLIANNKL